MKLRIKFPAWVGYMTEQGTEPTYHHHQFQKQFENWWHREVEPINKMLSEGVEVTGCVPPGEKETLWSHKGISKDTHKALLINIQPIEKDTPEKVLRDWLKCSGESYEYIKELELRAKKVLDAGKD